jgi:hypothetical protein
VFDIHVTDAAANWFEPSPGTFPDITLNTAAEMPVVIQTKNIPVTASITLTILDENGVPDYANSSAAARQDRTAREGPLRAPPSLAEMKGFFGLRTGLHAPPLVRRAGRLAACVSNAQLAGDDAKLTVSHLERHMKRAVPTVDESDAAYVGFALVAESQPPYVLCNSAASLRMWEVAVKVMIWERVTDVTSS